MRMYALTLWLAFFLVSAQQFPDDVAMIQFHDSSSFQDVQELARKYQKPIFIDFYSQSCGPCRVMDKRVFSHPEVAGYMNQHFINYKLDTESSTGGMLSLVYEVQFLPTLVIVKPDGAVILKQDRMMDAAQFLAWAKEGNGRFLGRGAK